MDLIELAESIFVDKGSIGSQIPIDEHHEQKLDTVESNLKFLHSFLKENCSGDYYDAFHGKIRSFYSTYINSIEFKSFLERTHKHTTSIVSLCNLDIELDDIEWRALEKLLDYILEKFHLNNLPLIEVENILRILSVIFSRPKGMESSYLIITESKILEKEIESTLENILLARINFSPDEIIFVIESFFSSLIENKLRTNFKEINRVIRSLVVKTYT